MSQPSAIAAVTETLRSLLAAEGIVNDVTAMPPDLAANPGNRRVNLFLYHIGINAALRNQEFPWQGRGGGDTQTNPPPFLLPLQLHYLLTAFADDDIQGHEALGHAMRVLHDHAQLTAAEIDNAVQNAQIPLPDSNLHLQAEKVKVALVAMSTDEMTKIWTAFQSPYRLSVAYEVSVVLIDSTRPSFTPQPVLRRGAEDRGPVAIAGNSVPVITALLRSDGSSPFTTGFAGSEVIIEGMNLGAAPRVRLRLASDQTAVNASILIATRISAGEPGSSGNAERCRLTLTAANLPAAGPLALCLEVPDAIQPIEEIGIPPVLQPRWWHSNEVGLSIAPRITGPVADVMPVGLDADVILPIEPGVANGQRAVLLLDGVEHPVTRTDATDPAAPVFTIAAPTAGTYAVRLRLDGVDLPELIKNPAKSFFEFALGKEVKIL